MSTPDPANDLRQNSGRNDPILQELWAVKAQINAKANYSVAAIVQRLHQQRDHLAELRRQAAPNAP
jgi:hypothetical protein